MIISAKRIGLAIGTCFFLAASAIGQQVSSLPVQAVPDSLPISPGDLVSVRVYDVTDLDQTHLRVTDDGVIPLLLVGAVKVAGLTPGSAASAIAKAYEERNFLRNAHISVTVDTYSASSVAVFGYVNGMSGAVAASGTVGTTVQLTSPKPLLTVLAMAGGLSDRASRTITIQRHDPSISPFKVFVPNNLVSPVVGSASNPLIYPGDTVIVPRSGNVYILGDVGHPTGVPMAEDGRISLMQALTQAGSTLPTSSMSKLMVFRKVDGEYQSLHARLDQMVSGKIPDIQLQPEDVVWVPFSYGRNLLVNGASIAAALGSATASGIIYEH